jgi:hypothetical protein
MMTRVLEAIGWSGSGVTLSLFCVYEVLPTPDWDASVGSTVPRRRRMMVLEDEAGVLAPRALVTYDLEFAAAPSDLARYLREILKRVIDAGARVAWFGFEGSFDYQQLLTGEIADQIYAVATSAGQVWLALDDATLISPDWRESLDQLRRQLR